MSQYYKPNRKPDWNYGGSKWTLSRSKIDLFMECPRCFYVDNKLGVARPPGFPFNLNSAVDALLKKEFDAHRALGTTHPLAAAYGVEAVPFSHAKMEEWRDALKHGVQCHHEPTGLLVRGAVDDIWVDQKGQLIVIDYKATSKDSKIESLDEDWHRGYKRQMEIYQWLLRQNGFDVSNTGYWVYANATKDREAFDGRLDFELTLVPYTGSTDWVDGVLVELKACLESEVLPRPGEDCDYCKYRQATGSVLQRYTKPASAKPSASKTTHHEEATLF